MVKRTLYVAWVLAMAYGIVGCQTPAATSRVDIDQATDFMVRGLGVDATSSKGRILKEVGKAHFSDPEQQKLMLGFIQNKDAIQVTQAMKPLMKAGLANLTDDQLKQRARYVLTMLERVSAKDCAKLSGSPNYSESEQLAASKVGLQLLSDEGFRDYIDMNFQAIIARLRFLNVEPPTLSPQELTDALITVGKQMPRSEQEPWFKSLMQPREVSDEAYCNANKSTYRSILTLHGTDAKRALRMEFANVGAK